MLTTVEKVLQRATPESQGIASAAILKFVEALESQVHEFQSFMLLRHGKVVAEGWWSPYGRDIPHMLFSLSKSFTSTAVGLAVAEGRLSLDDLVTSFFPDDVPAQVNDHLAAMRVRHLLSMSTGHDIDTMPLMTGRADFNWTKSFFETPVMYAPGTHFLYNTGASYMLSAIVQKTTGEMLVDYLKPRLFEPLGIENPVWEVSPQGYNMGGFGLNIKTEDIAAFGQLYLQKGVWEDRRILSEAWVAEATKSHVSNGSDPKSDWAQGYGFQFWRSQHNAYRGDGAFGQYCIVMPEQDAVLAITAGIPDMQQPLNVVWENLLPALGAKALPEDSAAQDKLAKKLSSLNLLPVQGKTGSAQAAKVSGKTYTFDANEFKIETISFDFSAANPTVTIKADGKAPTPIPCGFGTWLKGQTTVFNQPWETRPIPLMSSGAWTFDDDFTMVVRLYETPFYQTYIFHFAGDQLTVQTRINASFAPPKWVTLTAHS